MTSSHCCVYGAYSSSTRYDIHFTFIILKLTSTTECKDDDPFHDLGTNHQLLELIAKTLPTQDRCPLKEYVSGDTSLSVCIEMDDNNWEDIFLASFSEQSSADVRDV